MEGKPSETNVQNERGKTSKQVISEIHSHLHTQGYQHRELQDLPADIANRWHQLRQEYKDKGLVRSWNAPTLSVGWGVYPDEYYETELELLCGNMDPEQAANHLSALGIHNRALLKHLDTVHAFQYLKSLEGFSIPKGVPDSLEYAERVIAENPGTPIELEARFYIADLIPWRKEFYTEKAEAYQEILNIEPNSINALAGLGTVLFHDNKPGEAIPYFKQVNNLNPGAGHVGLGWAYEKLGDVKTAWIYYKMALANGYPDPYLIERHINQIEVGDPIYKPIVQDPRAPVSSISPYERTTKHHGPQKRTHYIEVLSDDPSQLETRSASSQDMRDDNDESRRAAAVAARQAHEEFLRYQELSQKELDDFLQWAETIMNAESPMDTNNFLMKEMEAHLKGGQAQFEPNRIVRAFETFERYGAKEGIKHLKKSDPDVAAAVLQLLTEKRKPETPKCCP